MGRWDTKRWRIGLRLDITMWDMALFPRRQKISVVELFGTIDGSIRSAVYQRLFSRVLEDRRFHAMYGHDGVRPLSSGKLAIWWSGQAAGRPVCNPHCGSRRRSPTGSGLTETKASVESRVSSAQTTVPRYITRHHVRR